MKSKMRGMSEDGGMCVNDLHEGLTNKSPKPPGDWSKPPSVNSDTTRDSVASDATTLGPRVA